MGQVVQKAAHKGCRATQPRVPLGEPGLLATMRALELAMTCGVLAKATPPQPLPLYAIAPCRMLGVVALGSFQKNKTLPGNMRQRAKRDVVPLTVIAHPSWCNGVGWFFVSVCGPTTTAASNVAAHTTRVNAPRTLRAQVQGRPTLAPGLLAPAWVHWAWRRWRLGGLLQGPVQ